MKNVSLNYDIQTAKTNNNAPQITAPSFGKSWDYDSFERKHGGIIQRTGIAVFVGGIFAGLVSFFDQRNYIKHPEKLEESLARLKEKLNKENISSLGKKYWTAIEESYKKLADTKKFQWKAAGLDVLAGAALIGGIYGAIEVINRFFFSHKKS